MVVSALSKWLRLTTISFFCIEQSKGMRTPSTSLRQRLLSGCKSYGPMVLSDSPVVAELLAGIGYDHIVIDMEHSPTDLRSCQNLLQAVDAAAWGNRKRTEPIVRLDSPYDATSMKKILDSLRLPGGVLVPMVDDAETARKVVESTRYPRQHNQGNEQYDGIRGCAVPFVRASSWGRASNDEYVRQTQDDLLVMVQVETPKGVDAIREIAEVDGIDLIFLGPFDLSTSAGKMGQFADPDIKRLIQKAEEQVMKSSSLLGGFKTPGRELSDMFDNGYSFICGSIDLGLMRDAARLDAQVGREAVGN